MKTQSIQIIKKKVDIEKLDGKYYQQIKSSIKCQVNNDVDILMIEITPKNQVEEMWILKSLLHLQREFTDILITPKNSLDIDENEMESLKERFGATMLLSSI